MNIRKCWFVGCLKYCTSTAWTVNEMPCHYISLILWFCYVCVCVYLITFKYSQWTSHTCVVRFIVISVIRNTRRINFYYWWNEPKDENSSNLIQLKSLSSFHSFSPRAILHLKKQIEFLYFSLRIEKKTQKQKEERPSTNRVRLDADSVLLLNRIISSVNVPDISQRENCNYSQPVRI